jgi:hypothetical protein
LTKERESLENCRKGKKTDKIQGFPFQIGFIDPGTDFHSFADNADLFDRPFHKGIPEKQ